MAMQGYWADFKAPAFRDVPQDLVAVLPIGAIEQHGPHLPVSVDRDIVDAVVTRVLPHLLPHQSVLFLPTLSVTKSGEHDRHAGTLSLSADTLLAVMRDIGRSVANAGVTRLVFLNGHGGNMAVLDIAARDLRIEHDLIVGSCSWFGFAEWEGVLDPKELPKDVHGGDSETSPMLAARPDTVDMKKARNFRTALDDWERDFRFIGLTGQAVRPGWIVDDLSSAGACGDASVATAEKGEALLSSSAKNFAAFLEEFARFDHRAAAQ